MPISFLSLPPHVRRQIYILSGLVRSCPMDLNHESPRRRAEYRRYCEDQLLQEIDIDPTPLEDDTLSSFCCSYETRRLGRIVAFPGPGGIDCVCRPPPLGLLAVCRAVHEEAIVLLYAENRFKICRTAPGGLAPLFKLGRRALRSMTSLHIRLNACGCGNVPDHICSPDDRYYNKFISYSCRFCHYSCKCGVELPLSSTSSEVPDMIMEWDSLITHLTERITPGRAKISIVCDTIGDTLPRQILSFMTRLPLLSECAIRLAQQPNYNLQSTIEEVVRQITTQKTEISTPNPGWNRLPTELQLQILRHTGLVRSSSVLWKEEELIDKSYCCSKCTDVLETCCCPHLHGAFTSMGCICRPQLLNFCLVSKSFRQQILRVFFSLNTFQVHTNGLDETPMFDDDGCQHRHRSVLNFLRFVPRFTLHFLRSIRVVFPQLGQTDLRTNTVSLNDWKETLLFMREHLRLDRLELTLCTRSSVPEDGSHSNPERFEEQCYHRIVQPVSQILGGRLKDVFIEFPPTSYDDARATRNRVRERDLRSQAMGKSASDSEIVSTQSI